MNETEKQEFVQQNDNGSGGGDAGGRYLVVDKTVYRLYQTGWKRGKPLMENAVTISVQGSAEYDDSAQCALARRIAALLNGEVAAWETEAGLEE